MRLRSLFPTGSFNRTRLKDRAKLSLGPIVYPIQTRRWLQFLNENPVLKELAKSYPRIIHKIYRPYLSNRLKCADRVDLLIGHYDLMFKAGLSDFVKQAAIRPITVCEFAGKSGAIFQLELSAINDSHREGELCLRLISNGVCLYSASFIFLERNEGSYIKIGCLQGVSSINGALWVKRATRDLHSFRPKNLLVSVIRDMGDYFGCKGTLLVSNENRISINRWRRRQISSNYDQTWEEMRATKRDDGDFELPCTDFQKCAFETLPSKKRSEAKKRSMLLESIFYSVRARLNELRSTTSPVRTFSLHTETLDHPIRQRASILNNRLEEV